MLLFMAICKLCYTLSGNTSYFIVDSVIVYKAFYSKVSAGVTHRQQLNKQSQQSKAISIYT